MSVLKYGIPHKDAITCANPTCRTSATGRADTDKGEIFYCDVHREHLLQGRRLLKTEQLREPGERNKPTPPPLEPA